ncbi:MAG: sugar phosphate nucleotidyltransferase [Candidatus Parvarchaeota archaeon]|nr:sugar phosphate nucleotidyltransferase [Candidatus Parvarchaeota archaeon]
MKARASFTIEADVLAKLDSIVDNITYRSKSDAVEDILRKFFEKQHTAIILCGGDFTLNGTDQYRPLIKIGNNTIIENTVTKLRMNGFRNILISGQTSLLKEVFQILRNGEGYGADIKYVDDNVMKGSARALERVKQYVGSTTLFVPGDVVFDVDLKDMVRFHSAHNSIASMAVSASAMHAEEVNDKLDIKGNKIVEYERLPSPIPSKLVPTSIFLFDKTIFKYIPPGEMAWDIRKDLLPMLAKDGVLYGYVYNGQWIHIKTKDDVERAKTLLEK